MFNIKINLNCRHHTWMLQQTAFARAIVQAKEEGISGWCDGLIECNRRLGPTLERVHQTGMTYRLIAKILRLTEKQLLLLRKGRFKEYGTFEVEHGNRVLEYVNSIVMNNELAGSEGSEVAEHGIPGYVWDDGAEQFVPEHLCVQDIESL